MIWCNKVTDVSGEYPTLLIKENPKFRSVRFLRR